MNKALTTGASEGLGIALAKRLASEDYSIIAIARNEEKQQNRAMPYMQNPP